MASFNITISNSLNLFGPAPSSKWAAYNWNEFLWGEGTDDLQVFVLKTLSEAIATTDSTSKFLARIISNDLFPTFDMGSEQLTDGSGYHYVFPDRTTEGEDRDFTSYTAGSVPNTSWSTHAASSTTWSAA